MKIQEVRAKAKAVGLKNTIGVSKTELIRRVQKAEGNFDCSERLRTIATSSNVASERTVSDSLRIDPQGCFQRFTSS